MTEGVDPGTNRTLHLPFETDSIRLPSGPETGPWVRPGPTRGHSDLESDTESDPVRPVTEDVDPGTGRVRSTRVRYRLLTNILVRLSRRSVNPVSYVTNTIITSITQYYYSHRIKDLMASVDTPVRGVQARLREGWVAL